MVSDIARRSPAWRAVITAALVAIVACTPATTTPGATGTAPAAATATATAVPDDLTLTYIFGATIDTLDLHISNRNEAFSAVKHVQESLVDRDPETNRMAPLLAESWTQPDASTWVFKLRSGVKFHNGEAFNAEAVKYSIERISKEGTPSGAGNSMRAIVASVEAVDDLTLQIKTTAPAPWFLERFTRFAVVPPKETAEKGDEWAARNPVGTGPYKFVEWRSAERLVLTRNDDYWGEKPAYKELVFREISETATALAELLAGRADIVQVVPADQVSAIDGSGTATVKSVDSQGLIEVALDVLGRGGETPLQNKLVRQALNHAVDRETIAKTIMGGYSKPVAGNISPAIFGHDPTLQPYPFDQAKAKQLLAEAGYPNGFDIQLNVYPIGRGANSAELGQAIAADLGEVGVKVSIGQISSAEIGPRVRGGTAGPMFIRSVEAAGTFDAALALGFITQGSIFAYYGHDRVEELRKAAESSTDPQERLRLYAQLQRFVFDEATMIFGWTNYILNGVSNKVDWEPSADDIARLYRARPK